MSAPNTEQAAALTSKGACRYCWPRYSVIIRQVSEGTSRQPCMEMALPGADYSVRARARRHGVHRRAVRQALAAALLRRE